MDAEAPAKQSADDGPGGSMDGELDADADAATPSNAVPDARPRLGTAVAGAASEAGMSEIPLAPGLRCGNNATGTSPWPLVYSWPGSSTWSA